MERLIEHELEYIPDQEDIWNALGYTRSNKDDSNLAKHKLVSQSQLTRSPPDEPWDDY